MTRRAKVRIANRASWLMWVDHGLTRGAIGAHHFDERDPHRKPSAASDGRRGALPPVRAWISRCLPR